jgi:hypothetical protein
MSCRQRSRTPGGGRGEGRPRRLVLTEEQEAICGLVARGLDVRVLAHAGTGKTQTMYAAVRRRLASLPGLRVLFLVYNRQIKEEARESLKDVGERVKVHSYDAAVAEYYDATAPMTDFQLALQQALDADVPVRLAAEGGEGLRFDLLVVDEAQDIDELYMRLLEKLLRDNRAAAARAQIVSVGDPKQRIYGYRGASSEYFVGGEGLYRDRPDVATLTLSTVFRFGSRVADFVNRICKPLFQERAESHWREDHSCAATPIEEEEEDDDDLRDQNPHVLRYVLPSDDAVVPAALLSKLRDLSVAYPDDPPVVMTGSRLEWNRPLWLTLEQLQDWEPNGERHLVTEDPQTRGDATVLILNAHSCKGRDYANVVLFLTNARTWLGEKDDAINAEILYVALTRCRRQLILVESFQSLVFQRVVKQLLPLNLVPQPRCACTGRLDLGVELERAVARPAAAARPRTTLRDFVERSMNYRDKARALALLDAGPLALWETTGGSGGADEGLDALEVLALWLRHDHVHGPGVSDVRFDSFLRALEDPSLTSDQAYARLSDYPRLFTPRLREIVERARVRAVRAWDWTTWLEAASLHASFHCGHSLPKRRAEDNSSALNEAWEALQLRACGEKKLDRCELSKRTYGHRGLQLSHDEASVELLILEATPAERVLDRLVAACAVASCGLERYSLLYLAPGKRVHGRLPKEHHLELRDLLRRALDLR